tara:strand:+ start:7723 stop:8244 length:522 start_codon:yes stop_codon:yes gene_type:complete
MNSNRESLHAHFLEIARQHLVVHLTEQITACLDNLNDQMIWWRANEKSNAIGNLVLHCAGSTRHHIGYVVGETDFIRNRDAEFTERSEIPKSDLLARLIFAVNEADEVLKQFDPGNLLKTPTRGTRPTSYMEIIDYQLIHYAAHTGQIAFATKMLKADAIDDIWRKISSKTPQ